MVGLRVGIARIRNVAAAGQRFRRTRTYTYRSTGPVVAPSDAKCSIIGLAAGVDSDLLCLLQTCRSPQVASAADACADHPADTRANGAPTPSPALTVAPTPAPTRTPTPSPTRQHQHRVRLQRRSSHLSHPAGARCFTSLTNERVRAGKPRRRLRLRKIGGTTSQDSSNARALYCLRSDPEHVHRGRTRRSPYRAVPTTTRQRTQGRATRRRARSSSVSWYDRPTAAARRYRATTRPA